MLTGMVICLFVLLLLRVLPAVLSAWVHPSGPASISRRAARRPPPEQFPAAKDFGGFEPGRAYRARSRQAWLLAGGAVYVRNPVRVSAVNARTNRDHWLFEQATGRWFFVRGNVDDACCEVLETEVPDEIKDRAFACWCREQDKRKKGPAVERVRPAQESPG